MNAVPTTTTDCGSTRKNWLLCLAFIGLAVLFYCLPTQFNLAMERYSSIVESLRSGQNWGRQALVGSLEYAPLPSLFLLTCQVLGESFKLTAGKLYSAICQAVLVLMLLFWQKKYGQAKLLLPSTALVLLLICCFPPLRALMAYAATSPAWLTAALFGGLFYQLCQWQQSQELRPLVMAAACLSLLVLCGSCGILLALGTIPVALREIRTKISDNEKFRGLPTLLLMPLGYSLLLYFVWNWLVMNDPFFFLRDYWSRASSLPLSTLGHLPAAAFWLGVLFLLLLALIATLSFDRKYKSAARLLLPVALLLPLHFHFTQVMQVYSGCALAYCLAALLALMLVLNTEKNSWRWRLLLSALSLALLSSSLLVTSNAYRGSISLAPQPEQLTEYIDQFWPDSRIMLYGLPLAVTYPDLKEKRFQARLDYQEADFLRQAYDEQLHLLVPPLDGKYYPARKSALADIYTQGRPWLFLEKQWPGGWQLWRCVIPPKGESKLDILR